MPTDIREQLVKYLTDIHSTEENAIAQLRTGADSVDDRQLADAFRQHLAESEEHERLIRSRLEAYDATPSTLKDLAQRGGAKVTGTAAKAASDTAGKMAIQAYSFEHLEIASYRMLQQVAERAGDAETVQVAQRILAQERAAAQKLDELLESIAEHDLEKQMAA